ncbi:MAG TPA: TrkA C-terminal domain-containing protein [Verrucomicrobiae bacterium]|nr:TrkA C-terminal domain-containing protein [Verrucomicrobiae bacterium]
MILAIMRQKQVISNPSASETFAEGDLLIVLGTREQLTKLESIASGQN